MFYRFSLPITAGTTEDTPVEVDAPVATGIITRGILHFPSGCNGMVKVRVFHLGQQLWPTNTDDWLIGNRTPIDFREDYDLRKTPPMLKLKGASPGTSYNHTVTVMVEVLPPEAARPWEEQVGVMRRFLRAIGATR